MTLQQALDSFILEQRLRGNTDKTISNYQWVLSRFCDWLVAQKISKAKHVTLTHAQQYQLYLDSKESDSIEGAKLTKRTVQTYMRHVRIFLRFCYHEGFIKQPIHEKLRLPKAERPMIEILTDAEVDAILATFSKSENGLRNRAIVCLLLDCGLRISEVAKIKTADVNFEKGYMKVVGKGRKERIVPVGLKVRRLMLAYVHKRRIADDPDDDAYFFLNKLRKPLGKEAVKTLMTRLKIRAGIPRLHAHLFRHTFATNFLVNQLGDIYELSRLLGHTETKTTEVYLNIASYYMIIEKKRRKTYLDLQT